MTLECKTVMSPCNRLVIDTKMHDLKF